MSGSKPGHGKGEDAIPSLRAQGLKSFTPRAAGAAPKVSPVEVGEHIQSE